MRFNLMHCSNSTVGENVSKTQKLINYSVLEKSLTFGYCHAISVAKWTINGLNLCPTFKLYLRLLFRPFPSM